MAAAVGGGEGGIERKSCRKRGEQFSLSTPLISCFSYIRRFCLSLKEKGNFFLPSRIRRRIPFPKTTTRGNFFVLPTKGPFRRQCV